MIYGCHPKIKKVESEGTLGHERPSRALCQSESSSLFLNTHSAFSSGLGLNRLS